MTKLISTIFSLVILILSLNSGIGTACSAIVIKNSSQVFLAKNFDWTNGDGYLLMNLRGVSKRAFYTQTGDPVSWTSVYGSVTFNQNGKEMPYGGMNEKGLTVEMLWLDNTNYGEPKKHPFLNELEWIQYQLDNFSATGEVISNLNNFSINPVKGKIHYIVADLSGKSAVIDFIDDTIYVTEKNTDQCQAITNHTAAKSQINYVKQPLKLKGNNTSHLHRYNVLQRNIDGNNFKLDSLNIANGFNVLKDVAISKGSFRTYWSIVYDLNKGIINYKTDAGRKIKEINLNELDFENQLQGIDVNDDRSGNITSYLSPYTQEKNTVLISSSFKVLGLEKFKSEELSDHQFKFNGSMNNSYTDNYTTLEISFNTSDKKPGYIIFAIMDSEENYKDQKPVTDGAKGINFDGTETQWMYYGLPKGQYSVAALQDKNQNMKIDVDDQEKPLENYAFSNGARLTNGEYPSFAECSILCNGERTKVQMTIE